MFLFINAIYCISNTEGESSSLVVPLTQLNHKLSLKNGIKVVNRALEKDNVDGKFAFSREFVRFAKDNKKMCIGENNQLYVCNISDDNSIFTMESGLHEVRFRTFDRNCITLGEENPKDNSFKVVLKECDDSNKKQIWLVGMGDNNKKRIINYEKDNADEEKVSDNAKESPYTKLPRPTPERKHMAKRVI